MDGNVVQHEWGNEIVWANTELYKGKILVFKEAGSRTPMQYHNNTDRKSVV